MNQMKPAMNGNFARTRFGAMGLLLPAVLALTLVACGKPGAQAGFATPGAAFDALVAALEKNDLVAANQLLGPEAGDLLVSGDAVQDQADRADFVALYKAGHSLQEDGADRSILVTGENDWQFPIPAVRKDGKWTLDGAAGADELVYRRVGGNEIGAIAVMRGFVEAQNEYADQGHDGDPAGIYALKLVSDAGLQNGLYWPTEGDEPPSPAGEFVAAAAGEGYSAPQGAPSYHGYHYRMLYKQAATAKGGEREYFKDGLLTQGFALVAWPADYGASGVMTFVVSQDGDVFQKDLGEDTAATVQQMMAFDPDSSWTLVPVTAPAG
ncbi:MAG: hypothetical protein RL030_413 [Pseudomonadota bacterium]|jgi:hypothetical protein